MEGSSDAVIVARVLRGDVEGVRRTGRAVSRPVRAIRRSTCSATARTRKRRCKTPSPAPIGRWHDVRIRSASARGCSVFSSIAVERWERGAVGGRGRSWSTRAALLEAAEEHPADRSAWREEIDRALQRLRPEQREAFLLKYVEDMGYDEMSQLTGVGVSALKMRVMRACERLRELLSEVHSA